MTRTGLAIAATLTIVALLFVAACSSGGSNSTTTPASGGAATQSGGTTTPPPHAHDTGSQAASTATSGEVATSPVGSGGAASKSPYCQKAEAFYEFDSADAAGADSGLSYEQSAAKYLSWYRSLRKLAPAQLRQDYDTFVSLAERFQDDSAGFGSFTANSSASAALRQATKEIAQYNIHVCGTPGL